MKDRKRVYYCDMTWEEALPRIAKTAHNAFRRHEELRRMADEWDDLPADGIERSAWLQVAAAVVNEMQAMMDEMPKSK
jgi:hypothetical protein